MNITGIDHIVLTVQNIEVSIIFYTTVLGMELESFGDNQKINLHEQGNEFKPNALKAIPGSQDLCFITSTNIESIMKQVKNKGIEIIEGPVKRTGATGAIVSFYFRDPDNNLIKLGKPPAELG
ncbi:MAG: VOC family protein [Maribacter sp.]|nr:VOC family protein [Maribacter sp.]